MYVYNVCQNFFDGVLHQDNSSRQRSALAGPREPALGARVLAGPLQQLAALRLRDGVDDLGGAEPHGHLQLPRPVHWAQRAGP